MTRTIFSDVARTISVRLQISDAGKLALNDKTVVGRLKRDATVTLELIPGENKVSLELTGDGLAFTWTREGDADALSGAALEAVRAGRTETVRGIYLARDPERAELLRDREALQDRMAYATQRPWPERTPFTTTFGQPARETACTCERRQTPTLLQALELLNGKSSYEQAAKGAARYAALADRALLDELYLLALSRFPTERERAAAIAFLKTRPDRAVAVTDLLWTVVNTQEFLFQK